MHANIRSVIVYFYYTIEINRTHCSLIKFMKIQKIIQYVNSERSQLQICLSTYSDENSRIFHKLLQKEISVGSYDNSYQFIPFNLPQFLMWSSQKILSSFLKREMYLCIHLKILTLSWAHGRFQIIFTRDPMMPNQVTNCQRVIVEVKFRHFFMK